MCEVEVEGSVVRQLDLTITPAAEEAPGLVVSRGPAELSEWLPLSQLYDDSPGATPAARQRWAQRRAAKLSRASFGRQARCERGPGREVWEISPSAVWHDGRTVAELLAARLPAPAKAPPIKPPEWDRFDDKDRDRSMMTDRMLESWRALKAEFPALSDKQRHPIFVERYGQRLRKAGLAYSLPTIYRYDKKTNPQHPDYDGNRDGRRLRRDGEATPPGSEAFRSFFAHVWLIRYRAAQDTLKPAWRIAHGWALEHGEQPPGYALVRRWANRVYPEPVRAFYRNERRWLREHVESVRREKSQHRPNEMWSGDWHRGDFLVLHNGRPIRPWLAIWEDLATGMVVSWVLTTSANSDELIMSYGEGVLAWGAPLGLLIDNGRDYRARGFTGGKRLTDDLSRRLNSVCEETGTTPHFCWPFNPGSKPPESWFKTFCTRLARLFPSYVGNKPDERPEHLYAELRAGKVEVGSLEDARLVVGDFIENVANEEGKSSLGGRSPLQAFAQDDPIPKRTAPEHVIRHKLMARAVAKVGRGGTVVLDGIKYGQDGIRESAALYDLKGQDVQIRHDRDRSRVFVYTLAGKFICEARNDRLYGTTDTDVRDLRRRQKAARKRCREALPAAKFAERDLSVQALVEWQKRHVQEEARVRKAAGAETLLAARPLQLLPGAAELIDRLPTTPRASGTGARDAPGPLDAVPMPAAREPADLVNPVDTAPTPAEPDDTDVVNSLDDVCMPEFDDECEVGGSPLDTVTPPSAEPDDVVNLLDALPELAARADDEWRNPLDTAG
ncbi:MAG: Mu transposase C-terminal domain-containing protein [Planctomycetota bacterium]